MLLIVLMGNYKMVCTRYVTIHVCDLQNIPLLSFHRVDRAFGKKNVEYIKFEKDFVVSGWPEGIAFKQPINYGKNQVKVIMESKDNIEFSAIDRVNVTSNEGQRATPNAQSSENDSNRTATINEAEALNDGITKKRKFRGKTSSFVKKGDIIPCLTEDGTYWLF